MSAFCSCFRSNPQVTDNGSSRRGSTTKKGIRKENKPMDLLELNKRGMDGQVIEEDGEWIEDDQPQDDGDFRASNQTDMLLTGGREDEEYKYKDSCERAIDDFMRSPKHNQSRNLIRAQAQNQSIDKPAKMSTSNKREGAQLQSRSPGLQTLGSTNGNNSFKKTGVCVSKCYQMLCGRCGRRFAKVMMLELTAETENQTAFEIQSYFNSTQNHDYECPFCYQKAQIILSEQMLVGDASQLDYCRTLDKASQIEKIRLAQQMTGNNTTASSKIPAAAGAAMSSLGLASGYLAGEKGTATSDNFSQDPAILEDAIETRPQLLYTKFQRLKNTTKLAKVILVDELPIPRARPTQGQAHGNNNATFASETDRIGNQSEDAREGGHTNRQQTSLDKLQNSKALLYYPEENHIPNEQACQNFNSRIMKHLMKQKMQKNETFYVNKVLNGDNHFLRRAVTSAGGQGVIRQRPSSRQVRNSATGNALALSNNQNGMNKSNDVLPGRGVMDTSRHVQNHESTNMLGQSGY